MLSFYVSLYLKGFMFKVIYNYQGNTMQPVYIDCHGFPQFHKVLSALYSPNLDLGRFISDVETIECEGSNSAFYDRFTVSVLPSDPIFAGSHCHLHEYLMDNLPLPARFITCDDYDDPDLESSENTMIDHSGYSDLFIERLIHNNNS